MPYKKWSKMMQSLKILSLLQVLACCLFQVSYGKSLRTISAEEYRELNSTNNYVAVHFNNADARKDYPYFLREYRKAVDLLDSYGVELVKVDCQGLKIRECQETNLYLYKDDIFVETLGLDIFFSQDSLAANILQAVLKDEINFVSNTEQIDEVLKTAKISKKTVVFCYVKAYGLPEHAVFVKLVFVFAVNKNFEFVITTNKKLANYIPGLKKPSKWSGGSIAVHACEHVNPESSEHCKIFQPIKTTTVYAAQLLQLIQLPSYEYLAEDGTTTYTTLPLSVNKVYIFINGQNVGDDAGFKALTDDLHGSVGFILVDVNKHKGMLSKLGLSDDTSLPTAALIPASPSGQTQSYVVLFPDQNIIFTYENLKHYLIEWIHYPLRQSKNEATTSSLKSVPFDEYTKITSVVDSFLPFKNFLVVAFCEKESSRSECRDFVKVLRRLTRTFDRRKEAEVAFVHVLLSDGGDNEIGTSMRPYIQFYSKGDENFITYKGIPEYQSMMEFIEHQTKLSIIRLQPSYSDEVPISDDGQRDKSEENMDTKPLETEESQDDENNNEDNTEVEPPPPPEETEDDEVAGSVWRTEPPIVPEDKVPSLTDKTFQPSRDTNDLLVVNFFQPWDARSQALLFPYVDAAQSLGSGEIGESSIRLARVNCFDWTDVCQKNNITTYPTIKVYRKGIDEYIYKGPLDSENLVKTVLMLKTDSPLKLKCQDDVDSFLTGKLPINAGKTSYISVLGLFSSSDSDAMKEFNDASKELRGSFLFGFVSGKDASSISKTYGLKTPGILVIKRNDPLKARVVFDGEFAASSIVNFVQLNSLQSFGELTPLNLPLYHMHGRPLLITFRASAVDDNTYGTVIQRLAKDDSLRQKIFFTWMSLTSNDVNEVILKSYTGKSDVPALVIVNHKKGLIYQYKNEIAEEVSSWVERCLLGEEHPTSKLKEGRWQPLLEGYDFLALMEEEEKKKRNGGDDIDEQTGPPIEKTRQRKPEDLRDEHEKRHDEL